MNKMLLWGQSHRQPVTRERHVSIHQHDAFVEVGGFAVDAVDFLQQAAAGEGYLGLDWTTI